MKIIKSQNLSNKIGSTSSVLEDFDHGATTTYVSYHFFVDEVENLKYQGVLAINMVMSYIRREFPYYSPEEVDDCLGKIITFEKPDFFIQYGDLDSVASKYDMENNHFRFRFAEGPCFDFLAESYTLSISKA